jgi:hypothetical protein
LWIIALLCCGLNWGFPLVLKQVLVHYHEFLVYFHGILVHLALFGGFMVLVRLALFSSMVLVRVISWLGELNL